MGYKFFSKHKLVSIADCPIIHEQFKNKPNNFCQIYANVVYSIYIMMNFHHFSHMQIRTK